jgi:RNA polymerase sigma-70 factor (ECF subfamily)
MTQKKEAKKTIETFAKHEIIFNEQTGGNFKTYYDKYYPKLTYYISKMCGDKQISEDIATESFMTAFEKIDKYDKEKAQFSTWLFTIARNIALQQIKLSKKTISIDVVLDDEGTTLKDFIPEDKGDNHIVELNEKKTEIMLKHISELKNPYKTVIEMREIKKMSYKNIANHLGKNLSTIKSQIRMGRSLLVSKSEKEFEQLDEVYL